MPNLSSSELTAAYLADLDCVVICTDHSAFDYQLIADHAPLIIDTRNAMADFDTTTGIVAKA